MAECDWAILCDYAFLDSNRKQCLIGAFDNIFAANVPSGLPRAAVALKILGNPSEQVTFRLEILRMYYCDSQFISHVSDRRL